MKKKTFPCIRNLQEFKKGCPRQTFDFETGKGCYAWVGVPLNNLKNPQEPEHFQGCVDIMDSVINHRNYLKMDSLQASIENLRNGLCMKTKDGVVPRPNPAETMTALSMEAINLRQKENSSIAIESKIDTQIENKVS